MEIVCHSYIDYISTYIAGTVGKLERDKSLIDFDEFVD